MTDKNMSAKICVNCKYYVYNSSGKWHSDTHLCGKFYTSKQYVDLVTGNSYTVFLGEKKPCCTMRLECGECGPQGRLFEETGPILE